MRAASLLLVLLAFPADAGYPGCPECDEARARLSKLGPDAAAAALLGRDAPWAEDRLVELGARAIPSLLKQFAGSRCAEPKGAEGTLTEAQEDACYDAQRCEQVTGKALAAVLCDRDHPMAPTVVAQVSKRLDARLVRWLPLGGCTDEVLDALVPRVLAVVGIQKPRGPLLESLVPLDRRALAALPWAVAALDEDRASQVPALHLIAALRWDAKEAWPQVAALVESPNPDVAAAALDAAVRIGEVAQYEPLLSEAIARGIAEGCDARTYNLLRSWPRGGGPRLAEAAALVLRSCAGRVDAADVLHEVPGAGRRHRADLLGVLFDERRPIHQRALLAELLLRESWEPSLGLSAADEAYAQRLVTKARLTPRRFSTQQVLPRYAPSPWLDLGDVDNCRAEAGLAPLDAGWPVEGADSVAVSVATRCLSERWCGPTPATFAKAIAACCAAFDASVPAWCTAP